MATKSGVSTAGVEYSPARKKRMAQARQRQEQRWAKKAGPLVVRQATPEELAAFRKR